MKYNQSFRLAIGSFLCLAIMSFVLVTTARADLNEELGRLRLKYETLYKQYTQNLSNRSSSDQNALSRQVGIAKREYEKVLKQFRLSNTTKSNFKERVKKIKDTTKRIFNHGNINHTKYTASGTGRILPGYATASVSIDGNNYCGQYAMTMALKGMGIPTTGQEVYKATNPAGIFTSSDSMVEYLSMQGVKASSKQKASVSDIIKRLDAGNPVMALVDANGTPHWVCIIGYKRDVNGKITSIITRDSYWGTRSPHTIAINEFEKIWKTPVAGFLGNLQNYSNYMIAIDGKQKPAFAPPIYSSNFWTSSEDNFGGGVGDTVAGFKNMEPMRCLGGVTKLVLGIPGSVLAVSSNVLFKGSKKILNWGTAKWQKGGIANKLIGGSAVVAGGLTKAVAAVGRGVAGVLSSASSIIGNGIKKLGYVFAR